MKWIGQHIYDLVARFRGDVYLEDISTGTIASGGNLGLDSNNKIVKQSDTGITDLHGAGVDGSNNQLLTDDGDGTVTSEAYLTFENTSNISTLTLLSDQDTSDYFKIKTTTSGSTTLMTFDDDGNNADFEVAALGDIILDANGQIKLEPIAGNNILLDGTVTVDGGAVGGLASLTSSADLSIVATGNDIQVDTDLFQIFSATTEKPLVEIKSTTNDEKGSTLQFTSDRGAAGVDGDNIGTILFVGDNNAQQQTSFAKIIGSVSESADGSESGKLEFFVSETDGEATAALTAGLTIEGEHNVDGEIDVTIAAGAASTTTIAGTLTMGSTAALTNAGLVAVANQSSITGLGTISSGVWNGTAIASAYMASATDSAKGAVELATTAETTTGTDTGRAVTPDGLKDGYQGSTNVTTLGTIATGTWEGTAIASDQQKHVMHYQTTGYSNAPSNYEISKQVSANTAPFQHDQDIGADGLTAQNVSLWLRSGGHVMPRACTLKRWTGWAASNGSSTTYIALFRVRPVRDDSTQISAVLLDEFSYTALGNSNAEDFDETSFTDASLNKGDIVFTAMKGPGSAQYFNGTLEVEF